MTDFDYQKAITLYISYLENYMALEEAQKRIFYNKCKELKKTMQEQERSIKAPKKEISNKTKFKALLNRLDNIDFEWVFFTYEERNMTRSLKYLEGKITGTQDLLCELGYNIIKEQDKASLKESLIEKHMNDPQAKKEMLREIKDYFEKILVRDYLRRNHNARKNL